MRLGLRKRWLVLAGLLLAGTIPAFAQGSLDAPKESPARSQVDQLIRQAHADVSVSFRALDRSQQLFINADKEFPASHAEIKIPILMELFAEVRAGELQLTDTVTLHNGFRSILDGSDYQLDPEADPDKNLYKNLGKPMTLHDLCEHMVARNSSLAADLLIEKLGEDRIQERIKTRNANGIQLVRGIEPGKANDTRPDNSASARGIFESLWTLAKGQDQGDDASKDMIGMMARGASTHMPTAGVPQDPRSTQSQRLAGVGEDAMIVYGPRPYVVVIIVRGIPNAESRNELMALIEHALAAGLDATP